MRSWLPAALLLSLTLSVACGTERSKLPSSAATTVPTVTVGEVVVDAGDLPGCTLDREGEFVASQWSRSFDCENNDRLTLDVWFQTSVDEAQRVFDEAWGTMDAAKQNIRAAIALRPVRQDSLKITDPSQSFGSIGAPEESIYCATYTDTSGRETFTQYFGAFQYNSVMVQYTSWASSGGTCDGSSRAQQNARLLATKQLEKLRAAVP